MSIGSGAATSKNLKMRELIRSNDVVFLSALNAGLADAGIEAATLDGFASSLIQAMNVTAEQRVMVLEEDYWDAWAVLAEIKGDVEETTLLGGRVRLLQPLKGFRAAIDAVLLAACVPAENGDRVLDVGCGSGAATFSLLARAPWTWVNGVDFQEDLIGLAKRAASLNEISERVAFLAADITTPGVLPETELFDHVLSNPPYLPPHASRMPAHPARAKAMVESTADLAMWIDFCFSRLRDGGTLSIVHRKDRADELIALLMARAGDAKCLEIQTKDDGRPAKRVVVQATKGAAAGPIAQTRILLHDPDGSYSPEAQKILLNAEPLVL